MSFTEDQIGSLDLTNDEADIVHDALAHYHAKVMVPMLADVLPEDREGYIEDNHRMEAIIMRLEMLIEGM